MLTSAPPPEREFKTVHVQHSAKKVETASNSTAAEGSRLSSSHAVEESLRALPHKKRSPSDAEQHEYADDVGEMGTGRGQQSGGMIARPRPGSVEARPQPRRDDAEHHADVEPGRHPRWRMRASRSLQVALGEESRERQG